MVHVKTRACLICIDGWGVTDEVDAKYGNAIHAAETPVMDRLKKEAQYTEVEASGNAVGLPEGLMGNSEVGHLNIGAGRVVWQTVEEINNTIKQDNLSKSKALMESIRHAKEGNGRFHLAGLISDGGVHSHINHVFALLDLLQKENVKEIIVHFFGDGRDTDPKSGAGHLEALLAKIKGRENVKLGTMVGRYYAMDRDKRWERIAVAIEALVDGKGEASSDPVKTLKERYDKDETDEFLKPIVINGQSGRLQEGDTLFCFNYRSDRMRELVTVLGGLEEDLPIKTKIPKNLHITTMTQYAVHFTFPIAFPPQTMDDVLAETLSKQGVKQCHIAETEKYAHVTFFFNGGVEKQFKDEHRELIPSPKVATYDKEPGMSVMAVAAKTAEQIASGQFEFVMNNLANPDMVGHTGVYEAAVEAVGVCDKAIGEIVKACAEHDYTLFITADHGNAERMLNDEGGPLTSHTLNRVPVIMVSPKGAGKEEHHFREGVGALGDIAPTILSVMGLAIPEAMTGHSLLA